MQRRLHTFVCILLCIGSWRGPVPVIHHHAQYDSEVRERHEHRFHAEMTGCCELESDWHWHLAIPGEDDGNLPSREKSFPSEILTLACRVAIETDPGQLQVPCVLDRHFEVVPSFELNPEDSESIRSARGSETPRTFHEFQRDEVALSALTGVATV